MKRLIYDESGQVIGAAVEDFRSPVKRRGRPLTKGNCATREELETNVRWFYQNTTLSIEAIGKRFGISQRAAALILSPGASSR